MLSPDVWRSVLNLRSGANEKRGSGVDGSEKRLGRAERRENPKRIIRGRSEINIERGVSGAAFAWPAPRFARMRVVRKPPGPNDAVNTTHNYQYLYQTFRITYLALHQVHRQMGLRPCRLHQRTY